MRYKPRRNGKPSIYRAPDPLIKPDYKDRTCLSCDKMFESDGPGNRICAKCAENHANYDRTVKIDDAAFGPNNDD